MASSDNLPAGWTRHEMAGRTFYYHAATNTTQHDHPGSYELTPSVQPVQVQAQVHAQMQAQLQPASPAAAPAPMQVVASSPAVSYTPPAIAAAQIAHLPVAPVQQAAPLPVAIAQPAAQLQQTTFKQVQVYVPEPGVRAGQQLAFTVPGPPEQRMSVTLNQETAAGSVVTVQYPAPAAANQSVPTLQQPLLPQNTVQIAAEEDKNQSMLLWAMYAGGFCCLCFIPPVGMLLWCTVAAVHFCKPRAQRAQYTRARVPAYTAAITCTLCCLLAVIVIPIILMHDKDFRHWIHHIKVHGDHGIFHHHGHHHGPCDHHHGHHHHGPWDHHGHHDHHHHGPPDHDDHDNHDDAHDDEGNVDGPMLGAPAPPKTLELPEIDISFTAWTDKSVGELGTMQPASQDVDKPREKTSNTIVV